MLERAGFLARDLRNCLVHHGEKPIHFLRFRGVPDILRRFAVLSGPVRVRDHVAVRIEEREERQASGSVQALPPFLAAGCVQILLFLRLLNVDTRLDEIFLENRLGFGGLDEPIEFPAPASPGGVKDHPDHALAGRRLAGCLSHNGIGGTRWLGSGGSRGRQEEGSHAKQHEPIVAPRYRRRRALA